jgi:hypothetical protein
MRRTQHFVTAVAGLFAAVSATGCTIHTEPVRVRGGASVDVRARTTTPAAVVVSPPPQDDAYVEFRDVLAPYGEWVSTPVCGRQYGPVWVPATSVVGRNFMPYATGGEWVPTDQGWSFVSDWDFGWATFHYGRWCADARLGWVWVPGTQWAPAWVDWRYGGGYVGWAPLPPAGVSLHEDFYVFVDRPSFASRRVTRYALPRDRVTEARRVTRPHARTVTHSGYSWSAGPPVSEVRREGGREVRPVHVVPPPPGKVRRVEVRRH